MKFLKKINISVFTFFTFLLIWEIFMRIKLVNPLYVSSPSEITTNLFLLIFSGQIFPHFFTSLLEIGAGFTLALIFGLIFGVATGWNKKFYKASSPFIYGLYSTPYIALIPLIIIWTGLGLLPKVIIIFIGGFLPIAVNTNEGIRALDKNFIMLGRAFNATALQIIYKIAMPFALPFIFAGIKQAIPRTIIAMVASEFFASSKGLGYLIFYYGGTFQTGKLIGIVFVLILISLFLTQVTELIESKVKKWEK